MSPLEINAPNLNLSITQSVPTITTSASVAYVGSETFTFNQAVASTTWVIPHNMARHPAVSVVDSAGTVVFGEVTYDSANQITVRFSSGFAGKAYLN